MFGIRKSIKEQRKEEKRFEAEVENIVRNLPACVELLSVGVRNLGTYIQCLTSELPNGPIYLQ